jgi:hypothetical protein
MIPGDVSIVDKDILLTLLLVWLIILGTVGPV